MLKLQEMRSNGECIEAVGSMLLQWVNQLVTSTARYMCYFQYSKNVKVLMVVKGTEVESTEMLWDLNPRPSVLYIYLYMYIARCKFRLELELLCVFIHVDTCTCM